MKHTEIRRKLSAYLDNQIDAADRAKIEGHLAGCASCRKALEELKRTVGHLKSLPEVEPPPWLTARVMALVRDQEQPRQAFWRRIFLPLHVKLPLEAIALVFICFIGYQVARMNASKVSLTEPSPVTREESPAPTHPAKNRPSAQPPATPSAKPHPAPSVYPPVPERKDKSLTYAPPPAAKAPAPPEVPSAPESGFTSSESDSRATAERIDEQRAMEQSTRHEINNASKSMMQKKEMPAAQNFSPGSTGSRPALRERESGVDRMARSKRAKPSWQVEVMLVVDDPAGVVGAIEEAASRSGGSILRRIYSEAGHLLVVRVEAQNIPELLARLEHVGRLRKPAMKDMAGEGMAELSIRW
jgi:anti-sigma factor RsiW